MAHHVSGLGISPTSMDPRSHITDLYVFQKPGDADKTILVMNINPHSPMTADAVDAESVYEFGVDSDADALIDNAFRVRFSPVVNDSQTASVQLASGRNAAADVNVGESIIQHAPVTFGTEPQITTAGDFRFFAGLRSDPFFADPEGAANSFPVDRPRLLRRQKCVRDRAGGPQQRAWPEITGGRLGSGSSPA